MKMYIYSSYGVLDCEPLKLQAIENSIPESVLFEQNQELEGEAAVSEETVEPSAEKSD